GRRRGVAPLAFGGEYRLAARERLAAGVAIGERAVDLVDHRRLQLREARRRFRAARARLADRPRVAVQYRELERDADRRPLVQALVVLVAGPDADVGVLPRDLEVERGLAGAVDGEGSEDVGTRLECLAAERGGQTIQVGRRCVERKLDVEPLKCAHRHAYGGGESDLGLALLALGVGQ